MLNVEERHKNHNFEWIPCLECVCARIYIYMVLYMVDILQSDYFYLKHKNIYVQYRVMTVILLFYTWEARFQQGCQQNQL